MHKNLPILMFETETQWQGWLDLNFNQQQGIWIRFAKKNKGLLTINYKQALEIALCYGWIDGLINKFDEQSYLVRFTPRRANSVWSEINKEKVLQLIEAGKMQPTGLITVEIAKKSGAWDNAYGSQRNMVVPPDFQEKLNANKKALQFYLSLNKINQYAILNRILGTKKPETRIKNIDKFINMLNEEKKFYT